MFSRLFRFHSDPNLAYFDWVMKVCYISAFCNPPPTFESGFTADLFVLMNEADRHFVFMKVTAGLFTAGVVLLGEKVSSSR